jgi:ABC-type antimicrobial peptide transport system permease subunit
MRAWQLGMATLAFAGLLALAVAAVGIYSVLSYLVADRRHELGVRIALGAGVDHVTSLVMRWSFGMAAIGVLAGWLIAGACSRYIQPLLFNVSARDPLVFGSVAAVSLLVAAVASLVPAIRAARVDPLEALRTE